MADTTFEIRISGDLLKFGLDENEIQRRISEWLVLSLFAEGHVSSGKAARLLGISRIAFLSLLRARGIAYINYSAEELADEFDAVRTLNAKAGE